MAQPRLQPRWQTSGCKCKLERCQEFCRWLSAKERIIYRLPTEAEWEYACRAGSETSYLFGDDPEGLARVANVADATAARLSNWDWTIEADDAYLFTAPVGSLLPNSFGLHDMHGNVWEWCQDWFAWDYYLSSPLIDPQGPATQTYRAYRGGGWYLAAEDCRSATRFGNKATFRNLLLGFRVVREIGHE